ncbi:MAG: hypothetical protein R2681_17240 [Pyrinomonadaceae bacterium]
MIAKQQIAVIKLSALVRMFPDKEDLKLRVTEAQKENRRIFEYLETAAFPEFLGIEEVTDPEIVSNWDKNDFGGGFTD